MSSASPLPPPLPPPLPLPERPLSLVFYKHQLSKYPLPSTTTWSQFVRMIVDFGEESPCTVADGLQKCVGKKCPYKSHSQHPGNPMAWSPVVIEGLRRDKNVRALTMLSLDFDHITEEQARHVTTALQGRAYVFHTTHNNREGALCFRIVLPLSRPVEASLWQKFLAAAIDLLGVTVRTVDNKGKVILQPDRVCKNRDRLYYRPSYPKDAPHGARALDGSVLDVDAVLAHAAKMPAPVEQHVSRELPETVAWNLESEPVQEVIDLIARHMPDRQRHELALALGGMLRAHGATQEDAYYILHEGFLAGGSDDPEERAKTVEHTYQLDSDAAMTGFTRVSEIIGVSEARDIGYCLAQAAQDEFFERLADFSEAGEPASDGFGDEPRATTFVGDAPALPPPLPSINLKEIADTVGGLATHLARDLKYDTAILSVPLRRLLAGKAIGTPGGAGDVETVREGRTSGLDAEEAINEIFFRIGLHFEQSLAPTRAGEEALWGALAEVSRAALAATPTVSGKEWQKIARSAFMSARLVKLNDARERAKAEVARVEAARAAVAVPPPLPSVPPPQGPPDGDDWECVMTTNASGVHESTLDNARLLLTNHPDFRGHLRFNVVSKKVEATGGVPAALGADGFDSLKLRLADYLARTRRVVVDETKLAKRIVDIALLNKYDPIETYLRGLVWDGVPRLDVWLQAYCGAEKTETNGEYLRLAGRRWLISLVARGIKVSTSASPSGPGCKVDHVLVLQGEGGIGKSGVFSAIGGEWFCDTVITLGDKDSRMMAAMYWLCEMPELVSYKKSSHENSKAFFSQQKDAFRLPYGSAVEESLRRCLFVGTTNDEYILGDPTGNRKYLCVTSFLTDELLAALKRDRDQLLAEAVVALRAGERWWFNREEIVRLTEPENEGRRIETFAHNKIKQWWFSMDRKDRPSVLTSLEVVEQALELESSQIRDNHLQQVGYVMKEMGFQKRRDTSGEFRVWRYYATPRLLDAEKVEPVRRHLWALPGGKKDDDKK